MSGEEIFGLIIMVGSCWLCAAIFSGIAFWSSKRKDPMHFWSGSRVDPKTISDIPAYNRENAIMWSVYSAFLWVAGFVAFFNMMVAVAILVIVCVPGLAGLVIWYNHIHKKYKIL